EQRAHRARPVGSRRQRENGVGQRRDVGLETDPAARAELGGFLPELAEQPDEQIVAGAIGGRRPRRLRPGSPPPPAARARPPPTASPAVPLPPHTPGAPASCSPAMIPANIRRASASTVPRRVISRSIFTMSGLSCQMRSKFEYPAPKSSITTRHPSS